jgi:hypothetical protein
VLSLVAVHSVGISEMRYSLEFFPALAAFTGLAVHGILGALGRPLKVSAD